MTWFERLQELRHKRIRVHRMDDDQFDALRQTLGFNDGVVLSLLLKINGRLKHMALNFDGINAAIEALHQDVRNIAAKLESTQGSDAENQAKLDEAAAALRSVDAALDALAPDPEPMPEPAPEGGETPAE